MIGRRGGRVGWEGGGGEGGVFVAKVRGLEGGTTGGSHAVSTTPLTAHSFRVKNVFNPRSAFDGLELTRVGRKGGVVMELTPHRCGRRFRFRGGVMLNCTQSRCVVLA